MKKEAKEKLKEKLRKDQSALRAEIRSNKWAMKQLVDKQTTLKRQLPLLEDLIRSLD